MASKKPDVIVEDNVVYVLRAGVKIFAKTASLCSMIGKSNQWVGQLVSQGTLSKQSTKHGALFNLDETVHAYCDMLDSRAVDKTNPQELERQTAETSIKKAKAIVALMEAQELQGKMHRSEDVADMTADLIYTIRGSLNALPGRLAVDVAAAETPAEAAEIIRKEVHKVMRELAAYEYDPEKYKDRVRERRNWESVSADDGF